MEFVEEAKKKFQAIQEAYSGNFINIILLFSLNKCELIIGYRSSSISLLLDKFCLMFLIKLFLWAHSSVWLQQEVPVWCWCL